MTRSAGWLGWLIVAVGMAPVTSLAQEGPVVVRAARLLDVEGGAIVSDAVVVVEGDRIASVNPDALPPGAETIDLGDVTLLPGLIDAHTHLTGDLEGDWVHRGVTGTAAEVFAPAGAVGRPAAGAAVRPPAGAVDRPPELVCAA